MEYSLPCIYFCVCSRQPKNGKWALKKKKDNPRFVDEETIPLAQDEDYDNYNAPDASRVDERSFTEPDATEATLTLQLRKKVKRYKITALYKHLNVTGDPGLADMDQFIIEKKFKNRQH